EGLAREPRLVEPAAFPLRVGDGPGLLVLETDAGRDAEAEAAGVLRDRIHAQALAHRVEEHVARLDDRGVEADRPVPSFPPAAEEVVPEGYAAAARDAGAGRRRAAVPTAILKVDPGGNCPWTARLLRGCFGSCTRLRHSSRWMPRVKMFAS